MRGEVEMAVVCTGWIEFSVAGRAGGIAIDIFRDRLLMTAGAA